ncbi:hypothetical protein [Mycobacteroides abscessus]|uniref:hypothetical protein n=1 Tax=Mycobacteroides abscessus TaxID=36809 RepID=UPI0010459310|nr:hypothetical protein [Mycobacteroides abscessus]
MTQSLATLIAAIVAAVGAVCTGAMSWRASSRNSQLRADEAHRDELRQQREAAIERVLSDDLVRQHMGLIQLQHLKENPSSSAREVELIQKLGDRAYQAIIGKIVLRTANEMSELAQENSEYREGIEAAAQNLRRQAHVLIEGGKIASLNTDDTGISQIPA